MGKKWERNKDLTAKIKYFREKKSQKFHRKNEEKHEIHIFEKQSLKN